MQHNTPISEARAVDDFAQDLATIASIQAVPRILEVVCRTTGMGFAAVARVTDDRWIACGVRDEIEFGLRPGGELKVETTLCHEVREGEASIVIDDVARDDVFCGHPTPALYGFQSYISVPIRRQNGEFFGTLCALDPRPAKLDAPETIGMFELFADLIGFHLDARDQLATSKAALLSERETAELREQFIAVLGHDLRNPIAAVDAGIRMLRRTALDENGTRAVGLMEQSLRRMTDLVENVLDLARGRLGGGFALERTSEEPLAPVLRQVVAELQASWPERRILSEMELDGPVHCDRMRMGQLLSNLLANALTHGAADRPVSVRAVAEDGCFVLSVANAGQQIPAPRLQRLFQPYFRAAAGGLGLGLWIASEIAKAHGGRLNVSSTPEETRFTFEMELAEGRELQSAQASRP